MKRKIVQCATKHLVIMRSYTFILVTFYYSLVINVQCTYVFFSLCFLLTLFIPGFVASLVLEGGSTYTL